MFRIRQFFSVAIIVALVLIGRQATAANLVMGVATEPASMDPHYLWSSSTQQLLYHYAGFMTRSDADGELLPSIGKTWKAVTPTEWVFNLDPKAIFSNGAPVTTADVIASYKRASTLQNGSYKGLLAEITNYQALDDRTLKITTAKAYPVLPVVLSQIAIIPKTVIDKATTKDFLQPEFNISAGPYLFDKYVPGDRLELSANPKYFGPKAKWDHVTIRFLSESAARVAALLSGSVDVIDNVAPDDAVEIAKRKGFTVTSRPGERAVYFTYDLSRDVTPQATALDGKPLPSNPFKDIRVRKALALAINRDAIVQRVLGGQGAPMTQFGSPSLPGYNTSISPTPYNPAQAKKLLAEAGYPNGFALTVSCWNGRVVNDARICQAVGQMLQRVGLKMTVDVQPYQVLVAKEICHCADRPSFFMSTWSSAYVGEVSGAVTNVMRGYDKTSGKGTWNLGEYNNPDLNKLIDTAEQTIDDKARMVLMGQAMKIGMNDYFVLPLHLQGVTLAARKGLKAIPQTNEHTLADAIVPTN